MLILYNKILIICVPLFLTSSIADMSTILQTVGG
jgi:hypothetical protein